MTNTSESREHMEVIASCGKHVGEVDHMDANSIKMTKKDPVAGGKHHFIPREWVERVDRQVHLKKNLEEVFKNWTTESATA